MNTLPPDRRVLAGRTYSRSWAPEHYDPIQHYPRPVSRAAWAVGCFLAAALMGALAAWGFR